MKRIEVLLPNALKAVRAELALGKQVREEYDGYVASLLPSIRTAGLLPTLSFYTDIHKVKAESESKGPGRRDPRRFHVLAAIYQIILDNQPEKDGLLMYALKETYPEFNPADLNSEFPATAQQPPAALVRRITDAAIALKLALRNFEQIKK